MPGVTTAYQTGNHAGRPAASSGCILYSCTEHGLVYRSDGTTWITWLTLGGGTPDAHAASHESGGSDEIDATGLTGAGGSSAWAQIVDEDGSSFANYTSIAGTWASAGGVIQQTDGSGGNKFARLTAKLPTPIMVVQAETRWPSAGQTAGDNYSGLILGSNTAFSNNPLAVYMKQAAVSQLFIDRLGVGNVLTATVTLAEDIWYTLQCVVASFSVAVYLDGVLINVAHTGQASQESAYVGYIVANAKVDFRNTEIWVPQPI